MTTFDFIIQLFYLVDHQLTAAGQNQQQTQAKLYPPEVVTLALLFSLQGVALEEGNLNVWIRLG
ncbi:MAG: hypothetical protein QGI86_25720 [Candidatus Poribacteria bacterium]|jgi:hypothetical protein|nr:hypothetical protein [Candidatus Poribacteria bacterium]MDP6750720.1 hypothetical protein [Candidatus Poribacteria bacterium]